MKQTKQVSAGDGLPELLAPAGSPDALRAAIAAGADAVYFGGAAFSNRMRAKNFTAEELREAIALCHAYGVRCCVTVNTRVRDVELPDVLSFCASLASWGADALIVADLGIASEVALRFPSLALHASTQMSLATGLDGAALRSLGFSRMVVPRELSEEELRRVVRDSPLEIEAFVHGAHCVSYSGQCLMSWAMGGRSGNRGECAQPCRLRYGIRFPASSSEGERAGLARQGRTSGFDGASPFVDISLRGGKPCEPRSPYPLSLKDLCLAPHIPALIDAGVASLKIEGRQKSAAYVYGVTSIYRRLLDERRPATAEEMRELARLFSRDGFTDGYFTGRHMDMLGVRGDRNEPDPPAVAYSLENRRRPLSAVFTLAPGQPASLTLTLPAKARKEGSQCDSSISVTVRGAVPETASGAAITVDAAAKNLTKLGGTPFLLPPEQLDCRIAAGLFYPVAGLNALRREAAALLLRTIGADLREAPPTAVRPLWESPSPSVATPPLCGNPKNAPRTAEVLRVSQITPEAAAYFDRIYVPAYLYARASSSKVCTNGRAALCASLPALSFDDRETAALLDRLLAAGCGQVMAHTLGQLTLAKERGMRVDGSFRLNLTNSGAIFAAYRMGFDTVIASPELKRGALDGLRWPAGVLVYGRIPLMLTVRCFLSPFGRCQRQSGAGTSPPESRIGTCRGFLTDRKGERFPVMADGACHPVIYNSRKLWMADRFGQDFPKCAFLHYIFTDEDSLEVNRVVRAYRDGEKPWEDIRRMG